MPKMSNKKAGRTPQDNTAPSGSFKPQLLLAISVVLIASFISGGWLSSKLFPPQVTLTPEGTTPVPSIVRAAVHAVADESSVAVYAEEGNEEEVIEDGGEGDFADNDETRLPIPKNYRLSSIGGLEQERGGTLEEMLGVESVLEQSAAHLRGLDERLRKECRNTNARCAFWASVGECDENPGFMNTECAPACRTCNLLDVNVRCPPVENQVATFDEEHTMKSMFDRIRGGDWDELKPTILMQDPFVATFDDFMSPAECDRLIELGALMNFERSTDVGEEKFDGTFDKVVSETRTSTNSWCDERCDEDPLIAKVLERIAKVTESPIAHSESLQILQYHPGQFYRRHHDFIEGQEVRQCGPRVLTVLLYLSDVPAGGGTHFPLLDLTVMPKRGRALLWPSVLENDVMAKDDRTLHEALDVLEGVKYAANAWVHLFDFQEANRIGCAG